MRILAHEEDRVCLLLGDEYTIIQGGITWIANAEPAAAVSDAGGLGLISANAGIITEIVSAGEVVRSIAEGSDAILAKLPEPPSPKAPW